jgi:putative transcriptional regulator
MGLKTNPQRKHRAPPVPSPRPYEIRAARLRAGLSQSEAARLTATRLWNWPTWENGRYKMPPSAWRLFLLVTGQRDTLAKHLAASDPARNPDRVAEIAPHPDIDRRRAPLPPIR